MRFYLEPDVSIDVLSTDSDDIRPDDSQDDSSSGKAVGDIIEYRNQRYRAVRILPWDVYIEVETYRLGQQDELR